MTAVLLLTLVLLVAAVFTALHTSRPVSAQADDPTMRSLIESLIAQDASISFEFAEPLVPGNKTTVIRGGSVRVGTDYVCLVEVWNQDTRYRCTPFDNLVSVSFVVD
jgi:hypothetical protein